VYDITLTTGNSSDYTFGSFFTAAEPLILELLFGTNDNNNNNSSTNSNSPTMTPTPSLSTNNNDTDVITNSTNTTDSTSNNSTNTTEMIPPSPTTTTAGPSSLSELVEYVILIGPKGLRPTTQQPNFRFVAAGAYNSYKVVITDDWIDTPQVLQHEIG
jgi:hypothetical protein